MKQVRLTASAIAVPFPNYADPAFSESVVHFPPLVRLKSALAFVCKSRTSFYADIANGVMVPPVRLGARCVAFPSRELSAINVARIAGATDSELRALVARLVASRTAAD